MNSKKSYHIHEWAMSIIMLTIVKSFELFVIIFGA